MAEAEKLFEKIISKAGHGTDNCIYTEPYPKYSNHMVGADKTNRPTILIHSNNPANKQYPNSKRDNLEIMFNKNCKVSSGPITENCSFTLMTLLTDDEEIISYFFKITNVLVCKLGNDPSLTTVYEEVSKVLTIFEKTKKISRDGVQGLFCELTIINLSTDKDTMVEAWHNETTDRFDFNDSNVKIEVKSTKKEKRVHFFKASQLNSDNPLYIASFMVIPSGIGKTVLALKDEIEKKLNKTENKTKLNEIVLKTLGVNYLSSNEYVFDYNSIIQTLRFYDLKDISVIEESNIPSSYSNLSFDVDFSNFNYVQNQTKYNLVDRCLK